MIARPEPSLRARALRCLARRDHSREELRRKLTAHAQPGEDIDRLLDDLAGRGWLSDLRVAENAARVKARRFGPLKVAQLLRSRGLADEVIAAGIARAGAEAAASIEAVWKGRFGHPPADEREMTRQVRFLQGRGFPLEEVLRLLRNLEKPS